MHNAQLNGGEIARLIPIGMDGVPVYMNAESFRDAIERTAGLGTKWARLLAKPKFNGDFTHVDWYVPFDPLHEDGEYRIIAWEQATLEERTAALKILREFEMTLNRTGQSLKRAATSPDAVSFSRLLLGTKDSDNLPAIHFPGEEYLFIVDGLPVITFWGFLKPGQTASGSPFAMLYGTAGAAAAGSAAAAGAAVSPNAENNQPDRRWPPFLKWLLPLLLLLLLLLLGWWLFRSCQAPSVNLPDIKAEAPDLSLPDADLSLPDAKLPDINLPDADLSLPDADLPDINLPDAELPTVDLPTVDLPEINLNGAGEVNGEENLEGGLNEEEAVTEEQGADLSSNAAVPESVTEDPAAVEPEVPQPLETEAAVPETVDPVEAVVPDEEAQDVSETEPAASELSSEENALRLSPTELSSGNLKALEGSWQTRSGMMDSTTGRPLNLSYNYRNGEGELVVRRQDGSRCVTKANPTVVNGSVEIVSQGNAVCPDQSSYVLPKIKCEVQNGGNTDCHAEYEGQAPFKIRMYGN